MTTTAAHTNHTTTTDQARIVANRVTGWVGISEGPAPHPYFRSEYVLWCTGPWSGQITPCRTVLLRQVP